MTLSRRRGKRGDAALVGRAALACCRMRFPRLPPRPALRSIRILERLTMDYKDTLNLPRTDFPMKADLVTREPQRLEKWQAANLYGKIQEARAGAEKFVLVDGPPFANGDVTSAPR